MFGHLHHLVAVTLRPDREGPQLRRAPHRHVRLQNFAENFSGPELLRTFKSENRLSKTVIYVRRGAPPKKGGSPPLGVATSAILNRTRVCDALKRGVTTVGYGRGRRSRRTRTKVARIRSCCRPFVDYHPSTETAQGCKALCRLVGAPGFEPGTPCSQSESGQRHIPARNR